MTDTYFYDRTQRIDPAQQIRLECLILATKKDYSSAIDTISLAKRYEAFVKGN